MSLSDQSPVASPFDATSTAADVAAQVDLSGKTAIVTGGYSGIGLETVRALIDRGADVIVPVRSPGKAADSLAPFGAQVTTAPMDLAEPASVRRFVAAVSERLDRLDLLINNAGIMACPEARVGPGWESQFGVNHMGHFILTTGLMPLLQGTPGARVVALSSAGHKASDIRWDDIQFETTPYDKWKAYGQAKTANALFANALSRRLRGSGGLAFSLHPGAILTPLQRHLPKEEMVALGWIGEDGELAEAMHGIFKSVEQGAATTIWAATSPLLEGMAGVYCSDCNVCAPTDAEAGHTGMAFVDPHACDDASAERLWDVSEALLRAA